MKREVIDKTILDEFVEDFCKVVNKHVLYIICSGFVAIAHGRSRGTEDIDMILEKINFKQFKELHEDLVDNGFECMQSKNPNNVYYNYLINGDSVRYTKKGEFLPEIKVKFAKDELDEEQLKTRVKLPLTQLDVYFSSIEGNIAFKEELLKADKDLEDAKHLRIIYGGKLDESKINETKEKIRRLRLNER